VIREHLGLTGTNYGLGDRASVEPCTHHVDNAPKCEVVSYRWRTYSNVPKQNKNHSKAFLKMATILQRAWNWSSSTSMWAIASRTNNAGKQHYWKKNPNQVRAEIKSKMNGILCRCWQTYLRNKSDWIALLQLKSNTKTKDHERIKIKLLVRRDFWIFSGGVAAFCRGSGILPQLVLLLLFLKKIKAI